jgi:hypothetical protein
MDSVNLYFAERAPAVSAAARNLARRCMWLQSAIIPEIEDSMDEMGTEKPDSWQSAEW